ncbi:MAG: hypothetical protein ABH871_07045 [Pseudomonadota bacterium]
MKPKPRIIVVDRSVLASNLYGLLFAPLEASVLARCCFEDVLPIFLRREKIDLAIINSNVFGKKFEQILSAFKANSSIKTVKKIFLCREADSESAWRDVLSSLSNSYVILRPFHPDEFSIMVKDILLETNS